MGVRRERVRERRREGRREERKTTPHNDDNWAWAFQLHADSKLHYREREKAMSICEMLKIVKQYQHFLHISWYEISYFNCMTRERERERERDRERQMEGGREGERGQQHVIWSYILSEKEGLILPGDRSSAKLEGGGSSYLRVHLIWKTECLILHGDSHLKTVGWGVHLIWGTPHLKNRGPNSTWGQVICKTGGSISSQGTPHLKNRGPNSTWGQVIWKTGGSISS